MAVNTILIVEDEIKIARFLELELQYEGYSVLLAHDGRTGLEMALNRGVDLVLLDIMLPGLNGMEVCRRIRQHSDMPIIMLTAKDETMDKVMGLDLGADDYVSKPFAIEELLARMRTALKRKVVNSQKLRVGDLSMDLDKYVVTYKEEPIDLTKREYDLLKFLLKNKNIVLTREKIMEMVWGFDYLGDTNVVDVYISYLRSKIDDRYHTKILHTVRGVGYHIKGE